MLKQFARKLSVHATSFDVGNFPPSSDRVRGGCGQAGSGAAPPSALLKSWPRRSLITALLLALTSCDAAGDDDNPGDGDGGGTPDVEAQLRDCVAEQEAANGPWIDCVVALDAGAVTTYGHDELDARLIGAPQGSLDVVSLGCGGSITLGFAGEGIVDIEGPDFIVFENPFAEEFPEPGRVEVSEDGETWHAFPCSPLRSLDGCAGINVVHATPSSGISPLDVQSAGGDAFDLQDLGIGQAAYVRIVDDSAGYWSASGENYCDPGQGGKGGFDLDAIAVLAPSASQGNGG